MSLRITNTTLPKPGAQGVENRVVHQGFAAGAHGINLLQTAIAAAHACGHNKESWLGHLYPSNRVEIKSALDKYSTWGAATFFVWDEHSNRQEERSRLPYALPWLPLPVRINSVSLPGPRPCSGVAGWQTRVTIAGSGLPIERRQHLTFISGGMP